MHARSVVPGLTVLCGAALLAAGCREPVAPHDAGPDMAAALAAPNAGSQIGLDQQNGTLSERDEIVLAKGFNPTSPRLGDAIVATFFWVGPATITSVSDFLTDANRTPVVGNTYRLVESVTSGGIHMATYVATNVQNFPSPNPDPSVVYAVQATLSQQVTDGGVLLSAYTGVRPSFNRALGAHRSASGRDSTKVLAHAGAVQYPAGAMVYAVTLSDGLVGRDPPAGLTRLAVLSDGFVVGEGSYLSSGGSGSVDPQWTWYFNTPSTWLASAVVLNPH